MPTEITFLQGNIVCARAAIASGCRFFAGYPITPSSEIMEYMSNELPKAGGVFLQAEDEIASIAAVIGASWAGAKAMTATSGPGLTLMLENIGYAIITETPLVVVDVQRAGPSTGQATKPGSGDVMQVRWGMSGDYEIIALSPWSVQETYDMTVKAFALSEAYRVPTFLITDQAVAHLRENAAFYPPNVPERGVPPENEPHFGYKDDLDRTSPMPAFGQGKKLLVTGSTHDEAGYRKTQDPAVQKRLTERLCNKIRKNADKIVDLETYFVDETTEYLMCAYGFTARAALASVNELRKDGLKIGLVRPKTLWPSPEKYFAGFNSKKIRKIFVPEMNQGQYVREVQRLAHIDVVPVAKTTGEVFFPSEITRFVSDNV